MQAVITAITNMASSVADAALSMIAGILPVVAPVIAARTRKHTTPTRVANKAI